jgi:DNA-binding IclR family transcriptional regulator
MANHPDPTRTTDGSSADDSTIDEILAVIATEEPRGATADQVARAIGLDLNGEVVQSLLEELVEQGLLDRLGIGHGAVYTLNAMA